MLYKSPSSSDEIIFSHDNGLMLSLDSDKTGGKASIISPDRENGIELTIPVTEPSVFMILNDGTRVGLIYSGGYAFTTIEVPLGNEYPVCFYEGAERNLVSNEQGDVLSPLTPLLDLLTPDASGDRISAELVTPPVSLTEYTVFRIATKRKDAGGIVFYFSDGRKMEISTLQDQNGNTRGHAAITCFTPTYRYLLGEFVERLTTGSAGDGKAVSSHLPLGQYVIRESGAEKGVLVEDGDYEVSFSYQGNYVPLIWGSASVENKITAMQLNVRKVFQENKSGGGYVPKAGAVFGVYTNEEILNLRKGSLIGIIVTDGNGDACGSFKAPFGEYYLSELRTLPGYELNPYTYPFTYSDETAGSPLKTQFTDKGVIVEYRYTDEKDSQVVIRTLGQIPQISYKINGVVINTAEAKVKTAGALLIKQEITSIDHVATVSNIGGSELIIEFDDGDALKYRSGDKSFTVVITQQEGSSQVEVVAPEAHPTKVDISDSSDGGIVTVVNFALGLNNIRYRANLEAGYKKDLAKPKMKAGDMLIYRETDINAGTDRLIVENLSDRSRQFTEVNALSDVSTIEITDEAVIKIERHEKTLTLTLISGYAEVTDKAGVIPEDRAGLQPDGSYVTLDPAEIIYFIKDITINDTNNSDEFIRAKLDAVYAEGELIFNRAPLAAYKDGLPISPAQNMTLDKMSFYKFLLSDGITQAEVMLMPDNSLKAALDGKITSNFESYIIPVLESQGVIYVQTDANRIKTLDGMTYFVSESRTYARSNAYAHVTRIELNTADGIMRGIINDLLPTPQTTHPGGSGGTTDKPEKETFINAKLPVTEVGESKIPLLEAEEPFNFFEEDVPLIPRTGTKNVLLWWFLLFASFGAILLTSPLKTSMIKGKLFI